MSKTPPIPVPPGQKYCFVCEQALPLPSFRARKGKLYSPCKACAKKSHERTAAVEALIDEVRAEMREYFASRPPAPSPEPRLYQPMSRMAERLDRQEASAPKRKRAPRKAGQELPKP